MTTILLTGATGNLGSQLLSKFPPTSHLILLSRHLSSNIYPPHITQIQTNLLDYQDISTKLSQYPKIDLIVHLAGVTDSNGHHNFDDNVTMTKNLIKVAQEKKTNHFIFMSSNAVNYSNRPYALSKKAAEDLIVSSRVPFTIIRPTLILDRTSPEIVRLIKLYKSLPFIPLIDHGRFLLQPILISDVLEFILLVLHHPQAKNKIFSIGGKQAISTADLISLVLSKEYFSKPHLSVSTPLICFLSRLCLLVRQNQLANQLQLLTTDITTDNSYATKTLSWEPHPITSYRL